MKKSILLFFLLCLLYPAIGSATTVQGISSSVGYADMNGMKVTVEFGDDTSETMTWGVLDNNGLKSGVTGNGWGLSFTGTESYPNSNSSTKDWNFNSTNSNGIKSITIDALAGNTVFDIFDQWDNKYTKGSAYGYWTYNDPTPDILYDLGYNYKTTGSAYFGNNLVTWTFSDPVQVAGEGLIGYVDPEGQTIADVYGTLTFDFGDNLFFDGESFFNLDTDHMVPEPATFLLFGIGLLAMSGVSRKKRSA